MKALLVSVSIVIVSSMASAATFHVTLDKAVKNPTCARAALGLVQTYLKSKGLGLAGEINLRETAEAAGYLVIGQTYTNQSVTAQVGVFDMQGEDGTCTATHVKFGTAPWLDLQKMAFSQRYPTNN